MRRTIYVLHDLFLNYIPLVLILLGVGWWMFKPTKAASAEPQPGAEAQKIQDKPCKEPHKMPPSDEILVEFARDLSGDDPEIVAFAQAMMRDGKIDQTYYDKYDLYQYDDFDDIKGNGPEYFASAIIHAASQLRLSAGLDDPIRQRLLYVDWKEDLPELIEGFEAMLAPTGVKSGIDPSMFEDEALLPYYKEYKAPPIVSAHYRPIFSNAGISLLEVSPATGWDAYLFAAIPRKYGRRWNLTSLRARKSSPKKTESWVWDAYYVGEGYVHQAKPDKVPVFEKKDLRLSIKYYWEG